MALERERKYLDVDLDALQARLEALGAEGGEPYFESNVVFDRADGPSSRRTSCCDCAASRAETY